MCRTKGQIAPFLFSMFMSGFMTHSLASPQGGVIVGGSGQIQQQNLTTTIRQNSSSLAINWNSFNLQQNETVNFLQPNISSIALNRILGSNASQILGKINANGHVVLVNPNGIFFGQNASVNVGGLIASGLDIQTTDFMNGNYLFQGLDGTEGLVVNSGLLNASLGGSITLLGKQVVNNGLITANLGTVNLAAGHETIVTFDNAGLIGVRVSKEILQEELGVDPAVVNNGEVVASGGKILLTGSQSQNIFSSAVNTGELEQARSVVVNDDGSFTLGGGADVLNTGRLDVSTTGENTRAGQIVVLGDNVTSNGEIRADAINPDAGAIELHALNTLQLTDDAVVSALSLESGLGGEIKLLGRNIGLFDQSAVNASGATGGGRVLIGGDRQGLNSAIRNSEFVYLGQNVNVTANALKKGDGGKVILFAEDTARIYSQLSASGGTQGGDGGFIETSGKIGFEILNTPDISAINGDGGTWLIDPNNISIEAGNGFTNIYQSNIPDPPSNPFTTTDDGAVLGVDLIYTALMANNADVIVETHSLGVDDEDGNITFATTLDYNGIGTGNTLTLKADGAINFIANQQIYDSNNIGDSLSVNLFANGSITLNSDVIIDTQGGNFTVGLVDEDTPSNNIIPTSFTNSGTIDTTGRFNANGGNITITALGVVTTNGFTAVGGDTGTSDTSDNGATDTPGKVGGNVIINGSSVTVNGAINTAGSDGTYITNGAGDNGQDGGAGGNVLITASTGSISVAEINTEGGIAAGDYDTGGPFASFDSGDGGDGGTIGLNINGSGSITLNGNLTSQGTVGFINGSSGSHGDGGHVTLNGPVVLAGDITIDSTGAVDSQVLTPGSDGKIDFTGIVSSTTDRVETLTLNAGNVDFDGNVGSLTTRLGNISITATGDINATGNSIYANSLDVTESNSFISGDIDTQGSEAFSGNGQIGDSGSVIINSSGDITTGNIITRGAASTSDNQSGFAGGLVTLNSLAALSVASIDTRGGGVTASESNGFNGGNVTLDAADITVGNVTTSGTNAVTVTGPEANFDGGTAGLISITATDNTAGGTPSITLNGDIAAQGGSGTGSGESRANIEANVILSGSDNPDGIVTINHSSAFSTVVNVTGVSGGNDTLTSTAMNNDWSLNGSNSGTLNTSVSFSEFERLQGGDNVDDVFTLFYGGSFSGALDGGTGAGNDGVANALISTTVWGITGDGAVTVAGMNFTGIENLTGSEVQIDTFNLAGGSISGEVLGGDNTTDEIVNELSDSTGWNITASNEVTVAGTTFTGVENLTGSDTEVDTFNLNGGGVDGIIDGGSNSEDFIVNGLSADVTWNITDINSGAVAGTDFTDIENLTGSSVGDTFNLTGSGAITGLIDGRAGIDFINLSAVDTTVQLGAITGVTSNTILEINNIEQLIAVAVNNNTLLGEDVSTNWYINGAGSGSIGGATLTTVSAEGFLMFSNFDTLTGGTGADIFTIVSNDIDSIFTINGGTSASPTEFDTLIGPDIDTTWSINASGPNVLVDSDGSNNLLTNLDVQFSEIENITAGDGDDTFSFQPGATIAGSIDAGLGSDSIDLSSQSIVSFNLDGGFTGRLNFEQVIGNYNILTSMGNSTIIGANTSVNNWNIDGDNTGMIGGLRFINFNNLTGGTDTDTFIFAEAGEIDGLINGNGNSSSLGGVETIDLTAKLAAIVVEESNEMNLNSNGILDFTNIEQIDANTDIALNNEIIAGNAVLNEWIIDGDRSGTLNAIRFNGFSSLTGVDNDVDTFSLTDGGSISGLIDGGSGATDEIINQQTTASSWMISGNNTGNIAGINNFTDIENLTGSDSVTDTFTLSDGGSISGIVDGGSGATDEIVNQQTTDSSWSITGNNAGNVGGINNFTGIENLTGSDSVTDSFTLSDGGSISGVVDGGSGATDEIVNQQTTTANWGITGVNQGSVDGINYFTDIENLTGSNSATDSFILTDSGSISGIVHGGSSTTDEIINQQTTDSSWSIAGNNAGNVGGINNFTDIENLTGSDSVTDSFTLSDGGSISGLVDGGSGTTDEIVNQQTTTANWGITGVNQGSVDGINYFTDIENLTGSDSVTDSFTLSDGGSISGIVGGGLGTTDEIVNQQTTASSWTITGVNQGSLEGISSFIGIENLTGSNSATDSFILTDSGSISGIVHGGSSTTDEIINQQTTDSSWSITGNNAGNVGGINNFTDIENLTGSDSVTDSFTLSDGGSISGLVDGGSGTTDEIVNQQTTTANWGITGVNQGSVDGINYFTDIENLTGSDSVTDSFTLSDGGSISGIVDGGLGTTDEIVNQQTTASSWTITGVNQGSLEGISSFTDIENLTGSNSVMDIFSLAENGSISGLVNGGSSTTDEIISLLTAATIWNITGDNSGDVNSITHFAGIENLTGSAQNDRFNYTSDTSSISGEVKGNLVAGQSDTDIVNMSPMTTALSVELGVDFSDIESFIGNAHNDSVFTAANLNNDWRIYNLMDPLVIDPETIVSNQGTVTDSNLVEVTFESFNNITGGDLIDNFLTESNGGILGTINGGDGNDAIDLSSQTGVIDKTVGSVLNGLGSVDSIEGIRGNGTQSILRASDAGSTWTISGVNSGTVTSGADTTTFTDFNILQGGAGDDVFNVTETGAVGNQLATDTVSRINGGAGDDALTITLSGADAKINLFAADGFVSTDGTLTFSTVASEGSGDSIVINGATANFDTATYSVNYGLSRVTHSYATTNISALVSYESTENVNDSVQAENLIISGTGGNNIVSLTGTGVGEGGFDVSTSNPVLPSTDWSTVFYQNKGSLAVTDLSGAGIINIMSDLSFNSVTGVIDFQTAELINSGNYLLTANELRLDSLLVDPANTIFTNVNQLLVSNSSANITLNETSGIDLLQTDTTGLLTVVSANGDIGDNSLQGLSSSGDLNLSAMNGSILLDNPANNLTGTVALMTGSGGSATFNNSASTTVTRLGATNVGSGSLSVVSTNADIISTDVLVANDVEFDAGDNNIDLTNANNDFDTLTVISAASLDFTDTDDIELGRIALGSGSLQVTAMGITQLSDLNMAITQTADASSNSAGIVLIDSGTDGIDLSNAANDFIGDVSLLSSGSSDVYVADANDIQFAFSSLGSGVFTVNSSGNISQSDQIIQEASAALTTLDAGVGQILLDNVNNDFTGAVSLTSTGNNVVSLTNSNGIILGDSSVGGSFDIEALNGDISQVGSLTIADNASFTVDQGQIIRLDSLSNNFQQNVSFFANGGGQLQDVLISNNGALDLGNINVSRHLVIQANGDVTNSGVLNVGGLAWIEASGNSITLDNSLNNFNDIVIADALNATITDIDDINIGSSSTLPYVLNTNTTITNNLSISTVFGNITDSVGTALSVGGTATFSGVDITLDELGNDFNEVNIVNAQHVSLADVNAIGIRSTLISGGLDIVAVSGITNTEGSLNVLGASSFTAGNDGNITIDHVNNQLTGSLTFASTGTLANVSVVNTLATDIQVLTLNNNLSVISSGAITQSGAFNIDSAVLTAVDSSSNPQNIVLDQAANNIARLSIANANDVTVNNGSNSLSINGLMATGTVSIASGVLTSINDMTGSDIVLNAAGSASLFSVNATGSVDITSQQLSVSTDITGTDVTLNSGSFTTLLNSISASGDVRSISSGFSHGGVISGNNITLDSTVGATNIRNAINAQGALQISSTGITTDAISDISATSIAIDAGSQLANIQGDLNTTAGIDISATGLILGGAVVAGDSTTLDARTADAILNNSIVISSGDLSVSGNNISQLSDITSQSGNINLLASNNYLMDGDIFLDQALVVDAQSGNITQNGNILSEQGDLSLSAGSGDINMASIVVATATTGNISYSAEGDVSVAMLSALNGTASVSSTSGQLVDSNDSGTNFLSDVLDLKAATGIGGNDAFETEVSSMDINNSTSGDILLLQTGDVEFVALQNVNGSGLIDVRSNGDYFFNPGSVAVSRSQGTIFMGTTGNYYGVGAFDLQNADITANAATFFAISGTFGTTGRPLVLDVPISGIVYVDSLTNSIRFSPETPDDLVTSGLDISALGVISAIAGEQLVEIESLGDIDPAIFTDLQNFSKAETSIRMPRDQLFEDELEEENQPL